MENKLYEFDEVVAFIKQGFILALAGDEKALSKLPNGNWIAGTIPYFINADGGTFEQTKIFVNKLSTNTNFKIIDYSEKDIANIAKDSFDNGYSLLILPPFQKVHETYALQTENLEGLYNNPIMGWVAGTYLNSEDTPKTFNGQTGEISAEKGIAIHVELPENKFAQINIINIFEKNDESDEIKFYHDGFDASSCMINGKDQNLADYIIDNKINTQLPLQSDYMGAAINVSIKEIDAENKKVSFFAPIFKNNSYKFPKNVSDYTQEFGKHTKDIHVNNEFSCLCILNYLYGELENKKIINFTGPATFGEIAYILVNQTLVTLSIEDYD